MKVKIKEFGLDLEVKNKGMVLDVYTPQGKFLGDVQITKTKLIWFKGKSQSGTEATWQEFIDWMES